MNTELQEEAKGLVNTFYQPLGYLRCNVGNDHLWEYSKARALEHVKSVIKLIEEVNDPEYVCFIYPSTGLIMSGEEKLQHYNDLNNQISKL